MSITPKDNLPPASKTPAVRALSWEHFREYSKKTTFEKVVVIELLVPGSKMIHGEKKKPEVKNLVIPSP